MRGSGRAWLTIVLLAVVACRREANPAGVGQRAPAFGARTLTGDSVTLASLKGKAVLLNIWATWCAPCRDEIPYLFEVKDFRGFAIENKTRQLHELPLVRRLQHAARGDGRDQ